MSLQNKEPIPQNDKITLATMALKVFGLIEKLLPAFLIAWNNSLQQKNKRLELKLETKEIEKAIEIKSAEIMNDGKTSKQVIDDFLSK
jgi:hypothetical protein